MRKCSLISKTMMFIAFASLVLSCTNNYNKDLVSDINAIENKSETEEKNCSEIEFTFLRLNEEELYSETKKIPYNMYEKNMVNYYKLWKINEKKPLYRKKFLKYANLFYKNKSEYSEDHFIIIESFTTEKSVPLLFSPGEPNGLIWHRIPVGTKLKILDYTIIDWSSSWSEIWYKVNHCGRIGYVSETWTDNTIERPLGTKIKGKRYKITTIDSTEKAIMNKKVFIGMTKSQVLRSWGRPETKNISTYSWGTKEQWVYGISNYLYFSDGILESIQQLE